MAGKREIEGALKSCGYSVRDAKRFVSRLPSRWFDRTGEIIPGAIERDDENKPGPVETLLARSRQFA